MTHSLHSGESSLAERAGASLAPVTAGLRQDVEIRPLRTTKEFDDCVELQRQVWGFDEAGVAPSTLLHVVEYVGGLAAGAFEPNGEMLGFVFGISGVRHGELVHWSHMLAVREPLRNAGLGRALKEYQRTVMAGLGIQRIFWSFDPLMAKNAHLNINRLGAEIVEYVPDMYGTTSSPLHLGMPTDRLIVAISTAPQSLVRGERPAGESFRIEVPVDVVALTRQSPATARTWRVSVREQFQWALEKGYRVDSVSREDERAFYVMVRP